MAEVLDLEAIKARIDAPGWRFGFAYIVNYDVPALIAEVERLREEVATWRQIRGQGCHCDPPGSGEEWCVGTCVERARADKVEAALRALVRQEPVHAEADGYRYCQYCEAVVSRSFEDPFPHEPDCPWAWARGLLHELTEAQGEGGAQ